MAIMASSGGGRYRKNPKSWQCLLGEVLADWNITARTAVLLVIVFTGLSAMMVPAFGAAGIATLAGVFLLLRRTAISGGERASES